MQIKCKCCGETINRVLVDIFDRTGGDSFTPLDITRIPGTQAIVFETDQNWTGYELSDDDEEMRATIQCPECHQYPFDDEIHAEDIVQVIMFTDQPEGPQTDLDKLIESLVHCSGDKPCTDQCPMKSKEWKDAGRAACKPYSDDNTSVPRQLIHQAISELVTLKAQDPYAMTLDELRIIGNLNNEHVWPLATPPFLWIEINPYFRRSSGFWVAWRDVWEMLTNVNPTFVADNYDKLWRCFTVQPTEEQVKALKWERPVTKK